MIKCKICGEYHTAWTESGHMLAHTIIRYIDKWFGR